MPVDPDITSFVKRLAPGLMREFGGILPMTRVCYEVVTARRELDGQIDLEALDEMTHQLARWRLATLAGFDTEQQPFRPGLLATTAEN